MLTETPEVPALLYATQAALARLILEPQRLERLDGLDAAARLLLARGRVAPLVGLGAYAQGYPARLREALADTFEAVARLVGDDAFTELTLRYAAKHRPPSYNLNDAGARLPRHLVGDPLTRRHPYLPALALLEWKLATAFHAPTLPTLDPADIAERSEEDWARATLFFQPSVAVVMSRWPTLSLWELRNAPSSTVTLDVRDGAECVLVYRRELVVRLERVPRAEAAALRSLQRGRPLADVLERAADDGASEDDVGGWFSRWQGLGLLAGVATPRGGSL